MGPWKSVRGVDQWRAETASLPRGLRVLTSTVSRPEGIRRSPYEPSTGRSWKVGPRTQSAAGRRGTFVCRRPFLSGLEAKRLVPQRVLKTRPPDHRHDLYWGSGRGTPWVLPGRPYTSDTHQPTTGTAPRPHALDHEQVRPHTTFVHTRHVSLRTPLSACGRGGSFPPRQWSQNTNKN